MELGGVGWRLVHGLVMPNSFLGPNFPRMRGLILVLMSNVYYLAVILTFLGGYLVVTARYCSLLGVDWWLLLVGARYCSFPLLV